VHTLYTALRAPDGDLPTMAMASQLPAIAELRVALGLPPVDRLVGLLDGAAVVLVTCPRELDTPGDVPANVRYVGPILEGAGPDAGWRPPGEDAETPLVAVSLGTTPMDEGQILQRTLDALAGLPVRAVATVGPHLDPAGFAAGERGRVEGYVRHAAVLPHASLLVTHAGLGSVLAALAHAVPLVCTPLGREQPANAAAVERGGAGRVIAPDADVALLRSSVAAVLGADAYCGAAARLAATLGGYGDAAVEVVERAAARG
jgi:MGT family glycosyltransferase